MQIVIHPKTTSQTAITLSNLFSQLIFKDSYFEMRTQSFAMRFLVKLFIRFETDLTIKWKQYIQLAIVTIKQSDL